MHNTANMETTTTHTPIRLLVVDDQSIVREALCEMLDAKPGLTVVGEAADGYEAVARARELDPDVILMDLVMPNKDGIAAIREIMADNPDACILVLSGFSEDVRIIEALRAGAMGYVLKSSLPQELVTAIAQVNEGQSPLNPTVARHVVRQLSGSNGEHPSDLLTDRESQILSLVAQGIGNREIGEQLGISPRTVGTHISNMMDKIEVENRTQLTLYALRHGIAPLYVA